MTDVTGFGLAGHLLEMLRSGGGGAVLDPAAIPLLEGAAEAAAQGIHSSLYPSNSERAAEVDGPDCPLLYDPQTSGGLLAALPAPAAEDTLRRLRDAGYVQASIIGEIAAGEPRIHLRPHLFRRDNSSNPHEA